MTDQSATGAQRLAEQIDVVERAYEYMLAYAAQGRTADEGVSSSIREHLAGADAAIVAITGTTLAGLGLQRSDPAGAALDGFLELVRADSVRALAAIRLVRAQPSIASQLVDDLNASIHLRTLLTDLFLVDEVVKRLRG